MSGSKTRLGSKLPHIRKFLHDLFNGNMHIKRVDSLADATLGVMTSASLVVAVIGQALAEARGLVTKHAVKQVDRMLSNVGIVVWDIFDYWVPWIVGARKEIVVAMDWTDYDSDGQTTLVLSLVTTHGRATPLLWLTVRKDELKEERNGFEDLCLMKLSQTVPADVKVTILADRGFGDHKLFRYLKDLGFGYVIRLRGDIQVTDAHGETRPASKWIGTGGRANKLVDAKVTAGQYPVGAVVCVHDKKMKEPWCLVTSERTVSAERTIKLYARRWSIEPNFRDTKDIRFGMGLSATSIRSPARRDRLLLVNAFAIVLLTMLGAAGESLGMLCHERVL